MDGPVCSNCMNPTNYCLCEEHAMTTTQERLADALRKARLHVWASAGAEHMMDGFGPRSSQPSDLLLAEIDAVLAAHDAGQAKETP